MTDICEVIITAPDPAWLAAFARSLVEDRLVAGAHEIEMIRSIYRWNGEIVDRQEARVALHTRASHVPTITSRTEAVHPYEVPCVVAMPITQASERYKRWILAATHQEVVR